MTPEDQRAERFVSLLSQYERRLNAYILSLVPNWSDAEDIAQEVKVRLWQQFADYDPNKDFGVWSRAVAYYFILTYRQRSGRQPRIFPGDVLELVSREVSAASEELEMRHAALEGCLKKLVEPNRSLLLRWYSGRESGRQIAESIGRSFEAVRKSMLRIRQRLSQCIHYAIRQEGRG